MGGGRIFIGTSGWHYKHWIGTFYPAETKTKDQFAKYRETFDTVELNNPFYRLPRLETFKAWNKNSGREFMFSVKASRYITHMKKLNETDDAVDIFLRNAHGLGTKLGPILFQLPPGWNVNTDRLHEFLKSLPKKHRYVFEFRNATWYMTDVYQLLEKYNCSFCQYELGGHQSPAKLTADFIYIRLHGPGGKYQGSYSNEKLNEWALQCKEWSHDGHDVFVYFDNDQAGYAAFNARTLKEMVK